MGYYVPLLFVTFIYICLFAYITSTTQINALREDWASKRCYPMSMLLASYIPDPKDNIDTAKFSSDNFQFCLQELVDDAIAIVMIPIMATLSAQVSTANSTGNSVNTLRNSAASGIANPFNTLINYAWKKFGYILAHMLRIGSELNNSFQRIFGITLASVFAGISVFKSISNTIKLFINVCIILLIIIIALLFLIFITISPFIAILIIPTIVAIAQFGFGDQVGGMEDSLNCLQPGTLVKVKEGWKPIEELRLGEELWDGTVLGILYGKGGPSVSIDSVVISTHHIVYDKSWVFAKDHSRAVPVASPPFVYSLVTSNRIFTVKGTSELLLRDWTHLLVGDDHLLDNKISSILGAEPSPPGMGLVGPKSRVVKNGIQVTIDSLRVGHSIQDGKGTTRVTSIYKSNEIGNASTHNEFLRILTPEGWVRKSVQQDEQAQLMHIGTESGTFTLNGILVRDMNEVGKEHFYMVEDFLLSLLYQ